jgi:anaerobic magnesium-protoporphyrin IX monomethyl ester cyclase
MKIMIAYPPLEGKGSPMLTQNRQFQWYHEASYIFPVVPASAATMLRERGHEVVWADCITERRKLADFLLHFSTEKPDCIALETKTPVVKQHWELAGKLKEILPATKIVLMGDHVTALPEESLQRSAVDCCLTGGDYDFLLGNLVDHWTKGEKLEPGIWFRDGHAIASTGKFELTHSLDALPFIDRKLTRAHLYGEKWKKRLPFFYTMVGRDCPWHRCTFCAWTTLYPKFRHQSVERALDEVGFLIEEHGAREIFDDSGTFPGGEWLGDFCEGMIRRGYHRKILFSCNMRFDYLKDPAVPRLMKRAGFRKVKSGLESANQVTLDRIDKGITVEEIVQGCRNAARAGIDVHLTVMVGYPWETREDARRTLDLARHLMADGSAEMLQATVLVPYPGTRLYDYGVRSDSFRFPKDAYERFDMSEPVFRSPDMSPAEIVQMCNGIYRSFLSPRFILRRVSRIRSLEDIRYILRGAVAVIGHLKDFGRERSRRIGQSNR